MGKKGTTPLIPFFKGEMKLGKYAVILMRRIIIRMVIENGHAVNDPPEYNDRGVDNEYRDG